MMFTSLRPLRWAFVACLLVGAASTARSVEVTDSQSVTVSETLPRQEFGPTIIGLPAGFTVALDLNIAYRVDVKIGGTSFSLTGSGGSVSGSYPVSLVKGVTVDVVETYTFTASADAVFVRAAFPVAKVVRWSITPPETGDYEFSIIGAVRNLALDVMGDLTGSVRSDVVGPVVTLSVSTARDIAIGSTVGYVGTFAATLDRTSKARFAGVIPPPIPPPPPPPPPPPGFPPTDPQSQRADAAIKTAVARLAALRVEIKASGLELAYARLTELLNTSIADAQASLLRGRPADAEQSIARAEAILDSMEKEAHYRKKLKDAMEEYDSLGKTAKGAGVAIPAEKAAEFDALIKRAEEAAAKNLFRDAERLVGEARKVIDEIRKSSKALNKKGKENADDARKAAKDAKDSADRAADASKRAADASARDADDALEEALEAARRASEAAADAAERAKRAKDPSDDKDEASEREADSASNEAIAAALTAARNVAEAAQRVADNARKAADAARRAVGEGDVPSRRAAEPALLAAENAARRVAEAAALVAENAQRAAQRAVEKAKSGKDEDRAKADALAKEALAAVEDADARVAAAAELAAANAATGSATEALRAAGAASEALKKPTAEAQKLARQAGDAVRAAQEIAAKALREAELAASKAASGGAAAKEAAAKAREAAEKAKQAAAQAAAEARKAGKKAADLNDDGANDIVDLVLVAKVFGTLTVKLDVQAKVSDINGDGEVNIADLVFAAQGLLDGAILSNLTGILGAPSQAPGLELRVQPLSDEGAYRTVQVDVVATDVAVAQGFQLDLAFDPGSLEVVEARGGELLTRDGADAYWHTPQPETGVVSFAGVRLSPEAVSGSGVVGSVVFRLLSDRWQVQSPLRDATVRVADGRGRVVGSRIGGGALTFADALPPLRARLMQNYPNPFNPETWIPYQLPESADVSIRIFDPQGALVRTLDLGAQPAGYHVVKGEAAYWDGSNDFGERVASGMYFYTIRAGSYAETRKMLILK